MNKVLLVEPKEVISYSVLEQNVNPKVLRAVIDNVQNIQLKNVLGSILFNQVIEAVYQNVTNNVSIDSATEHLITNYIKPYLIYATLCDFLIANHYKITNKGVLRLTDRNGQTLSSVEIESVKDFYENQSVVYKNTLIKFLKDNDLIDCDNDTDVTSQAIGWFLDTPYTDKYGGSENNLRVIGVTGAAGVQGPQGPSNIGVQGSQGFQGSGVDGSNSLRFIDGDFTLPGNYSGNNSDFTSITQLNISKNFTPEDSLFISCSNWLNSISVGDYISIYNKNDRSLFGIYLVTSIVDLVTAVGFDVTLINGNGSRVTQEYVSISFVKNGISGSSGFQGNQGFQGFQGFQGNDGINGTQGFQGNQGFQGSIGLNGLDGFGNTNSVPKYFTTLSFTNSNISDNGSIVSISTDATVNGMRIGRGPGNIVSNVVIGQDALASNLTGNQIVAIGASALFLNTASNNTAIGNSALLSNTTGSDNTAIGRQSLITNTTGTSNTAIGRTSLASNTTGSFNLAIGQSALFYGVSSSSNVAIGYFSLLNAGRFSEASDNLAIGVSSGKNLLSGLANTFIGRQAFFTGTNSSYNTMIGYRAGYNTLGSNNVFIGSDAGFNELGSDKLYIANNSTSPLLFGDFASQSLQVNNDLSVTNRIVVGTSSFNSSAILELVSTSRAFLPPRMTTTEINAIASPTAGMVAYSTNEDALLYYDSEWGWWSDNTQWRARNGIDVFEDFLGGVDRATLGSPYSPLFMTRTANSGLIRQAAGGSNRPGVINLSTSTSTNAQSGVITGDISSAGYLLGGGKILIEADVRVPTLSDGTNTFRWWWGFSNNVQAPAAVGISSVVFYYDANNAFGYGGTSSWQLMTCNNNARSITVTSVPVVAGQWYRLKIVINATATQVDFSIDGTIVRSETNNIPATNIQLGLGCNLIKSAGSTERNIWLDYYRIKQKFTTQR